MFKTKENAYICANDQCMQKMRGDGTTTERTIMQASCGPQIVVVPGVTKTNCKAGCMNNLPVGCTLTDKHPLVNRTSFPVLEANKLVKYLRIVVRTEAEKAVEGVAAFF
eukprot:COSAG06_NODE_6122_length_3098_cov_3.454818_2_plen_109_part_00